MSANRLGKGLEAIIRPNEDVISGKRPGVTEIPLDIIDVNPYQPRKQMDEETLEELTASIREKGVLTPITVQVKDDRFILIAGERRWRAARKAGLKQIPGYIVEVKDDAELIEMALIENIQRENLNPIEEAEAFAFLASEFDLSQEAIAKAVGKKRVTVANTLRLLNLPSEIKASLRDGELSAGHGRAILMMKTPNGMRRLWQMIQDKRLSVRAAEEVARDLTTPKRGTSVPSKSVRKVDPQIKVLEDELVERLGTKVRIKHRGKQGTIEMSYFSTADLERLLDLLRTIDN